MLAPQNNPSLSPLPSPPAERKQTASLPPPPPPPPEGETTGGPYLYFIVTEVNDRQGLPNNFPVILITDGADLCALALEWGENNQPSSRPLWFMYLRSLI